jgi:hypothetical protein
MMPVRSTAPLAVALIPSGFQEAVSVRSFIGRSNRYKTCPSSVPTVIKGRVMKPAPDARILPPSSDHDSSHRIRRKPLASSAPHTPVNPPSFTLLASDSI